MGFLGHNFYFEIIIFGFRDWPGGVVVILLIISVCQAQTRESKIDLEAIQCWGKEFSVKLGWNWVSKYIA